MIPAGYTPTESTSVNNVDYLLHSMWEKYKVHTVIQLQPTLHFT